MQIALAPELSTWPNEHPQLIGSLCGTCAAVTFPVQASCPNCSGDDMSDMLLPRRGTLVSWTTQGFPPGPPFVGEVGQAFLPFGVGLVQLDEVVRVEGRLTESDPARIRFGMAVELTMVPLSTRDDGTQLVTFAFSPVEDGEGTRV
ncbi:MULTISPECIES: Zn-ribbon domain-containing OB-fold protein [unclassified Mycobacterium]|uniref:Zn-ribbon domain-containing OB-fold protein n=1 Tax=unclassified Mycobacterium TaxID=2642494 RepID=UPI0029C625AC|nr:MULTISPECIES: OB-fold domain-containing protein [unclassified Mycobacterium]